MHVAATDLFGPYPPPSFLFIDAQGVYLDKHNFYYLCDEKTDGYIHSPDTSPELWSVTDPDDKISDAVKVKLKKKVNCLLKQTDPTNEFPDYETECGLPLHGGSLVITTDVADTSSGVVPESNDSIILGGSEAQTGFTGIPSPTSIGTPHPTSYLLEHNETYDEATESPTVESSSTITSLATPTTTLFPTAGVRAAATASTAKKKTFKDTILTMPMYAIILASVIVAMTPFFLLGMYHMCCRRGTFRAGPKTNSPSKSSRDKSVYDLVRKSSTEDLECEDINTVGRNNVVTGNKDIDKTDTTLREGCETGNCDPEIGLATLNVTGPIDKDLVTGVANNIYSIWEQLAEEATRHARLRAKWIIEIDSGGSVQTTIRTLGRVKSCGSLVDSEGDLLESESQSEEKSREENELDTTEELGDEVENEKNCHDDDVNGEESQNEDEDREGGEVQDENNSSENEDNREEHRIQDEEKERDEVQDEKNSNVNEENGGENQIQDDEEDGDEVQHQEQGVKEERGERNKIYYDDVNADEVPEDQDDKEEHEEGKQIQDDEANGDEVEDKEKTNEIEYDEGKGEELRDEETDNEEEGNRNDNQVQNEDSDNDSDDLNRQINDEKVDGNDTEDQNQNIDVVDDEEDTNGKNNDDVSDDEVEVHDPKHDDIVESKSIGISSSTEPSS